MWTAYSTRETSEFVGLSESAVRACVREGLLAAPDVVPLRFSFQDLKILKLVVSLVRQGVSLRRARRQLAALSARLGPGESLASVSLEAHNGHVVVREGDRVWRADTGQLVFGFEFAERPGTLMSLPARVEPEPEGLAPMGADEWFDQALALEESDPPAAIAAYEQALQLRPDCPETLVNLGRLHAESGSVDAAALCFRRALDIDPRDATALYNLGVVAQDIGKDDEAVQLYERALALDPSIAEAHYNLATIFDRQGDGRAAIRHINAYRKLTRRLR